MRKLDGVHNIFHSANLELVVQFLIVLFLLLQEKYQKKQSQGALKAALRNAPVGAAAIKVGMNCGMPATGRHYHSDSLRGALPPCESPVRIAVSAGAP